MAEELSSRHFIQQIIDEDLKEENTIRSLPGFRRNQTDIFISDMQNRFF